MNARRLPSFFVLSIFILLLLAACGPAATAVSTPVPASPTPGADFPETGNPFNNLDPNDILVQLDFEPTFSMPQFAYEFGRVPTFTLLADGRVIFVDAANYPQVLQAQLSAEEALALVQQIWEMGFADLESHTDMCIDRGNGNQECIADASYTILRVRSENGDLREIKNYANFSDYPQTYNAIVDMLSNYSRSEAEAYQPQGATLFIQPEPETYGETALDWLLDPALLTNPPAAPLNFYAVALQADQVGQYLQQAGSPDRRFFEHEGKFYSASLVPWLPGVDYTQAIQAEFPQQ